MRPGRVLSVLLFALTAWTWLACAGNGCNPDPPGPPPDPDVEGFRLLLADAPGGAFLSGWADDTGSTWLVGGQINTERHEGNGFVRRLPDGRTVTYPGDTGPVVTVATTDVALWWVHGREGATYVGGEHGFVARIHASADAGAPVLTPIETGTDAILYGVFAVPGSDVVYAAGGSLGDGEKGVLLVSRGDAPFERVEYGMQSDQSFYKVWASSESDVFVVGGGGVVLHYDGSAWTRQTSGTNERLGVVWGLSPTEVFAAGGDTTGVVLRYDGTAWHAFEDMPPLSPLYGLSARRTDVANELFVSGTNGTVVRYRPGSSGQSGLDGVPVGSDWRVQDAPGTGDVLHSVLFGGNGVLALGGDLGSIVPFTGVMLAQGPGLENGFSLDGRTYYRNGSPRRPSSGGGGGFQ